LTIVAVTLEALEFEGDRVRRDVGEVYKELNANGAREGAVAGLIHDEDNVSLARVSVMWRKECAGQFQNGNERTRDGVAG
jgi:hypothetical protein